MKPCQKENHRFCAKDSLCMEKTITKGKFPVYKVFSPASQTYFALKAFPNSPYGLKHYKRECLLSYLGHPNIVQYIRSKHSSSKFLPVVTEYMPNGDMLDATKQGLLDSEIIIRSYFRQLIEGVEYLHSHGIAHLDLKLENLMLSADFTLKIIDFDQAQDSSELDLKCGGTEGYRAPEILKGECRDLSAADLYSIGVILYAMKVRKYPFKEVDGEGGRKEIKDYEVFMKDNRRFWMMKAIRLGNEKIFNEDFVELVNGLLHPNVDLRFKIEDVKKSKWYNGPIFDRQELFLEMSDKFSKKNRK